MQSFYFHTAKPFVIALCLTILLGLLFVLGTQLPLEDMKFPSPLAAFGAMAFLVGSSWAAFQFWNFQNKTYEPPHILWMKAEQFISLTMMTLVVISVLFGLMFYFHHTQTGIAAILQGSVCALFVPVVIWLYVSRINELSPIPARA
jgi:hypothetical protein